VITESRWVRRTATLEDGPNARKGSAEKLKLYSPFSNDGRLSEADSSDADFSRAAEFPNAKGAQAAKEKAAAARHAAGITRQNE
jgi:hypothetical protein